MIKEVYFSPVIGAAMFVDFVELCHRHGCMHGSVQQFR
jgi:hypothetical protein